MTSKFESLMAIVGKYQDQISEADLDEIALLLNEIPADKQALKAGDRVWLVRGEYAGREGKFVGWNDEHGQKFAEIDIPLKGDKYVGQRKNILMQPASFDVVTDAKAKK